MGEKGGLVIAGSFGKPHCLVGLWGSQSDSGVVLVFVSFCLVFLSKAII